LAGRAIPLSARIVSIADIYDALSSQRVYKPAYAHEECVAIIREEAGKQLDPDLVEVWLLIEHRFKAMAEQYADSEELKAERDLVDHHDTGVTPEAAAAELCVSATGEGNARQVRPR
jgi:HD-GYP domain-containing protein (c-di-GMP phosphodiesterase class II)